jgi:co-chaperonin GroES (HSP10)
MDINLKPIKGTPRAVSDRVLVTDMHFGEQVTKGGIILGNDDGKTRGIYPRWAKVYSKGPLNKDQYDIGQWILIEHGRWTRSMKLETNEGEIEVRMVDADCILAYSDEKPESVSIGAEYSDGQHATIDPSSFVN